MTDPADGRGQEALRAPSRARRPAAQPTHQLAAAADYDEAVRAWRWLHQRFRDQLEANGEGGGSG